MNKFLTITLILLSIFIFGCGGDDPPEPPNTNPNSISATNGFYYKAVMGTSDVDKPIAFLVRDVDGNPLPEQWVHFQRLIGDGSFSADSVQTNESGNAIAQYIFNGSLGHAEILAFVRNIDSVIVTIRADALIPGVDGQGQYILFEDLLEDVKNFNGLTTVDIYTNHPIMYVNYEYEYGVVIMLRDDSLKGLPNDTSEVYGVIVNNDKFFYEEKIGDSIGVGSSYQAVVDYFGEPDSLIMDYNPPPAWKISYLSRGLTLFGNPSDTIINEIHLIEKLITGEAVSKISNSKINTQSGKGYRLHR